MTRVLLSGASGFIATHILDILLSHGHSVRITVRSEDKAQKLISAHPEHAHLIDYVIVPDIAKPGAFDAAVQSAPGFEAVLHTASPFHFNVTDIRRDLLAPAVEGTTGILRAVHAHAPTVKRVVITSSFASIIDAALGLGGGKTYSEADWNPITPDEAVVNPSFGYRASKTFAERAAWEFVQREKPNFDVATVNPPLVIGPVKPYMQTVEKINTSNERTRDMLMGKMREKLSPTGTYLWVDVRDVAEAHVAAFEKPEAGGKRYFVVAGRFSNQEIADAVAKNYPEYKDKLPEEREPNNGYPEEEIYDAHNSRSREVLGLKYKTLEESVVDLVKSLKEMGL